MKRFYLFILIFIVGALCSIPTNAQHFKMKAQPSKSEVKKGEEFTVRLALDIEKDWLIYSLKTYPEDVVGPMPTVITLKQNVAKLKGKIKAQKPKVKNEEAFGFDVEYYAGHAVFELPLVAQKDINFAKDRIQINVNAQQCDHTSCLPNEDFVTTIAKEAFGADASAAPVEAVTAEPAPAAQALTAETAKTDTAKTAPAAAGEVVEEQSLLSLILGSMLGGLLALLTPCVFPMIPITVSFFTKRFEQSGEKNHGVRDAFVYALGIIFTFTAIGILTSVLFGATSLRDFSNTWEVNFLLSAIFIAFVLSLFGAFEIQLPTGLLNKLNSKSQKTQGLSGVILMGIIFALASIPCTGPVVGLALTSAAKGSIFAPTLAMLAFSTVLAAPFFILALFPKLLSSMPKSGGWMNNLKVVMGFIILAVTFIFVNSGLKNFDTEISRDWFLAAWIAISLLSTLYVLGLFRTAHDSPVNGCSPARLVWAIIFATITVYLAGGLLGKNLGFMESFLPPPAETAVAAAGPNGALPAAAESLNWVTDLDKAIEIAKKENKNLFLDFTGKHCKNCVWMERNIFPKPEVTELLKKMVAVKLVTDMPDEASKKAKNYAIEKFNTIALPFYVIMTPDGNVLAQSAYNSNSQEFAEFLKKGVK